MTLGQELRRLRVAHGLTLRQLAEETRRDYTYLSKVENDHTEPGWGLLVRLAALYDADVVTLYRLAGRCECCGMKVREEKR